MSLNFSLSIVTCSQAYGFSSCHVWMWELDHKKSWAPSPQAEADEGQKELEGKGLLQSQPQRPHLPPTVSRTPVANLVFLESWTVDICQECPSLSSAPQRRHIAYLGLCSCGGSGKLSGGDLEGEWDVWPIWMVHSPSPWSPQLLTHGKGTKCTTCPVCTPESTWEPEQLRPGKCTKFRDHLGQCPCRAPWRRSSVDLRSTCHLGLWQAHCGPSTASTAHTCHICQFKTQLNKWA